MHKNQSELAKALSKAAETVRVGGSYSHYKNGDLYKVLRLAVSEDDNEISVVYQALYGARIVFVRPLASWLDEVEVNGEMVQRFASKI